MFIPVVRSALGRFYTPLYANHANITKFLYIYNKNPKGSSMARGLHLLHPD